jgi:hypothetical protein
VRNENKMCPGKHEPKEHLEAELVWYLPLFTVMSIVSTRVLAYAFVNCLSHREACFLKFKPLLLQGNAWFTNHCQFVSFTHCTMKYYLHCMVSKTFVRKTVTGEISKNYNEIIFNEMRHLAK